MAIDSKKRENIGIMGAPVKYPITSNEYDLLKGHLDNDQTQKGRPTKGEWKESKKEWRYQFKGGIVSLYDEVNPVIRIGKCVPLEKLTFVKKVINTSRTKTKSLELIK